MQTRDLFHRLPPDARVLLIRLRSLGDCLLLTGPVRALKEEFPGFRISVLVEKRFAACFANNPDFAHIVAATGKLATAAGLFTHRYDAVINLHGGPTSLAYSLMTWGKRIGGSHYQYSQLYHGLYPAPEPAVHTVESTLAIFRWLGVRREAAPPLRYEPQPAAAGRIAQKISAKPYVIIHPGAQMTTKRWDAGRFAAIARLLHGRGLTVILTCGPGEESIAAQVAEQSPASSLMSGLDIPELAELIRGAVLYIGNDTGPMHLAAAVGTPTLAVWGSSDSRRWRPWSVAHRVVQNPFECNPCPGYRCLVAETPLCIESVTVDQVDEALKELLPC